MSATNTPEVEGKSLKINEDNPLKIDDMKDYLLQSLKSDELEDFIHEAQAEMIMRKSKIARMHKYQCDIEVIKKEFLKKRQEELDKMKKESEAMKSKLKRQALKDDFEEEEEKEEEEEDNDEESEEKPKPKRKYNKKRS
jgi:hypothetical protein